MSGERAVLAPGVRQLAPGLRQGIPDTGPCTTLFHLRFPGRTHKVREVLAQVMQALESQGLTEDSTASAELVLAEVLNNVVEHAYASRAGEVELRLSRRGAALHCSVVDEGAPMPDGTPPPGHRALLDVPLADLPEGGFGWFLIRSLTRELTYRRELACNRLTFSLPLDLAQGDG